MAKKKRKKRKKRSRKVSTLSSAALEKRLEQALSLEKYQPAIAAGRELLGRDLEDEAADRVRDMLRQAYTGRILALAEKNMLKEAFALIETAILRCGREGMTRLYLMLSIRAGKWQQAVEMWSQHGDELDKAQRARVESLFASLLLAGPEDVREAISNALPDNSQVKAHLDAAEKALDAFSEGQHDEARKALRDIPFRSPYRDFRSLLSGCIMLTEENKAGAEKFFHAISPDSAWGRTASALLRLRDNADQLVEYIAGTGAEEDALLSVFLGLKPSDLKFIRDVSKAAHNGSALLDVVTRHGKDLPQDMRSALIRRLLPYAGIRMPDYREFRKLNDAEKNRITALNLELVHEVEGAVEFWDDYISALPRDTYDNKLIKALVFRRKAELMQKDGYAFDRQDVLDCLKNSLEFDPEDPDAFLKAIELSRFFSEKQAYSLINDALKQFPENTRILTEAMKAASKRNAHKKAGRIAGKILEIDPINTGAKEFLLKSHLSHAAKLLKQGKTHLVEAEYKAAEDIDIRTPILRGRAFICHGLFLYIQGKVKKAGELVEKGCRTNGHPVIPRVITVFEAWNLNVSSKLRKKFESQLRKAAGTQPVKEDVLELARWFTNMEGGEKQELVKVIPLLKKYFSQAGKLDWTRQEGLMLCKGYYRAALLVQLEKVAARLHKEFPSEKEFEAYVLLSRTRHGRRMKNSDLNRMLDLSDELYNENKLELAEELEDAFDMLDGTTIPPWFTDIMHKFLNAADMEDDSDFFDFPDDFPEGPSDEEPVESSGRRQPDGPDKGKKKAGGKRKKVDKRQRSIFDLL